MVNTQNFHDRYLKPVQVSQTDVQMHALLNYPRLWHFILNVFSTGGSWTTWTSRTCWRDRNRNPWAKGQILSKYYNKKMVQRSQSHCCICPKNIEPKIHPTFQMLPHFVTVKSRYQEYKYDFQLTDCAQFKLIVLFSFSVNNNKLWLSYPVLFLLLFLFRVNKDYLDL